MTLYLRIFRYFHQFFWKTLLSILLMTAGVGLNLLKPWPFKYIVDGILATEVSATTASAKAFMSTYLGWTSQVGAVVFLSATLIIITLLSSLVTLVTNMLLLRIGLQGTLKLRTDLYSCLQSLPLKYHDARRSSDSSYRVAYDSQSIQTIYNKGFSTIFSALLMLVVAFIIMVKMDWKLTLISLVVLPLFVVSMRYYAERIRKESTSIQERESDLLATAQEGLSSIRMIQSFGREAFEVDQFHHHAKQSLEANFRLNITSTQSALVVGTLMALGTSLMYAVGALQVLHSTLSLGDLLVFASYLTMLYQPIEQLTYTAWALEGAAAGAQRCFEVLDEKEETIDLPEAISLKQTTGEISFTDVSFSYTPAKAVLKNITLLIPPGETVAFVGGTGTGKSTLLSLIPRFYDPCSGLVRIDGHDLRTLRKESVRQQIGMVFQETVLFSSTIHENIAYGREGATDDEIIEAAKRAKAYDFIMGMPHGFETHVGERGGHLSVGQRQRIGIARAFLKNAPLLLLDEPTSALDPETEKAIMETIFELMQGRTTLIVTHRISTVHRLNHIVVLKEGSICEQGSGAELLAAGGTYARLYNAMGN
ncbi:MAG: ABC transporter ATP-binding protein [Verrucomicrobia bacterium]|nr:MAG: ABC transporter ATP-binding protein [Verrucomicrobiota bacterium]MDH4469852.1 ABC transporter ATP-binding protein [Verrucomicrobiae bacterium]